MTKIFLSYRRGDSAGLARRIRDRLEVRYGDGSVVMDLDSPIPLGRDFRESLQEALAICGVALVIVAPAKTFSAFDMPTWVRLEIETVLASNIPVVPLLIDGTRLPPANRLPEGLRDIEHRRPVEMDSGNGFDRDMDGLIGIVDRLTAWQRPMPGKDQHIEGQR